VTGAESDNGGTLARVADDPDVLISAFFRRLDELESLAREITSRLQGATAVPVPAREPAPDFELVVVCTGNRVRSPVAAGFLRMLLADVPAHVSSAGVLDLGPVEALPDAIETATALGLDLSAHRASCVMGRDLSGADLVIGFEQRHVATAVVDAKARRERTFLLTELVQLLERVLPATGADPVARAREAIARADALRGGRQPAAAAEIPDPLGGSIDVFRSTIGQVHDLTEQMATRLFGADAIRPLPQMAFVPPARTRNPLRAVRER
jgi:protein-tyrosine phosphatase